MDIVIRKYESSDFLFVKNILIESFSEVDDLISTSLINSDSLNLDSSKYIQLVAVDGNNVLGYAIASRFIDPIVNRCNYWIDYVCVSSDYRGMGIGKLLMSEIEMIARNENVMFLQLTSSRFRTGARKMYSDLGYVIRESDIFRKEL